jgi:hypothetical protein
MARISTHNVLEKDAQYPSKETLLELAGYITWMLNNGTSHNEILMWETSLRLRESCRY